MYVLFTVGSSTVAQVPLSRAPLGQAQSDQAPLRQVWWVEYRCGRPRGAETEERWVGGWVSCRECVLSRVSICLLFHNSRRVSGVVVAVFGFAGLNGLHVWWTVTGLYFQKWVDPVASAHRDLSTAVRIPGNDFSSGCMEYASIYARPFVFVCGWAIYLCYPFADLIFSLSDNRFRQSLAEAIILLIV